MKIHLFYLWALLLFASDLTAQIVTVKDQLTQEPLELVTLYSPSTGASAVTDREGRADLSEFVFSDTILLRLIGYREVAYSYEQLEALGFVVVLAEDQISLEAVVVSASRWRQAKREVPQKITSVSPREVALQNPQTAADLLSLSGEVFIQKSQLGGGSPMIRGFATNRVLIAVDGVRMNTAIFRSGNLQNVISLDPYATERTEVLFGPGSVMYGSDAIGGAMNFFTLTPTLSATGSLSAKANAAVRLASANEEKTGHLDFSLGWKKWALATSASYSDYGDLKMGSNGPDDYLRPFYAATIEGVDTALVNPDPEVQVPTGYHQYNLLQKVRFQPNASWNFEYGFHYSATGDVPRYDRLIRLRNGQARSAEWYYGPQVWMMNALNVTHSGSTRLYDMARITLARQYFKESRHDRDFGSADLFHRTETVDALSANLDLEKAVNGGHTLFYGLEYIHNLVGSTGEDENIEAGTVVPGPARYPDGATWDSYSIYLTHQWKVDPRVVLQSGLRYSFVSLNAEFDTTFFKFPFTRAELDAGALTGSVGLVFNPNPHWQLSANFATGFRSPNVDDVGKVFDSEPGSVVVPNPDLRPEYAYNGEVGIARSFGGFLKLDLAAYYTLLDNALVRRNSTLNGLDSLFYDGELSQVQSIQNAAQATVWGLQAGLEAKLPGGFGWSARLNYQQGEEEVDDGSTSPLRHAAPWFGNTRISYARNRLKVDLALLFNGTIEYEDLAQEELSKDYLYAADKNGNPYSPGWYTLNLKFLYQLGDFLQLSGGVENLTDQRYRPYSSGIAGPGRNFQLGVRVKVE